MYRYSRFSLFATWVARKLGHPITFMIFLGIALLWLASGPLFHFSGNWYSAYSNTATIVTTLLLFLIQHTQSREIASIQFKLNEIIRVSEGAHNALLDIEEMTDRDYDSIKASYTLLAKQAREQLQSGKLKWATARVSMESLDSFLDPSMLKKEEDEDKEETKAELKEEVVGESVLAEPNRLRQTFSIQFASSMERMARIAAHSGHAPMALIAINEKDYDWLQKGIGFGASNNEMRYSEKSEQESRRLAQFLIAQVLESQQPIAVSDTGKQPLLPSMSASATVAAFAAIPLIGLHQKVIGCLAVLDRQPRQWSNLEIAALQDLAALTVEQVAEQTRLDPVSIDPQAGVGKAAEDTASQLALLTSVSAALITQKENENEMQNTDPNGASAAVTPASGTILVVDDSATNRTLLQRRLQREGYEVFMAGNGQEALTCLQTEAVGLVLLDVMMPEMDGEEVLQRMQDSDRLKDIPVIMVTALDEQDSVQRCLKAGAKDYLLKPFDPADLRARVRAYLPPPPAQDKAT